MSIFAASVCKRNGDPIFSRQFVELESTRVHELMSVYPRLLQTDSQHTILEENSSRYLYEPLDELFVVLISDAESSNILQDIKVLRLLTQLVKAVAAPSSLTVEAKDVVNNTFTIIDAFDEVVNMGYSEQLTVDQILNFLIMDSHEEKIQEIIERNKQLEAAEERKRRAREFELERLTGRGMNASPHVPSMDMSGGSRYQSPPASQPLLQSQFPSSMQSSSSVQSSTTSQFKPKGLQLGKKPASAQTESLLPSLTQPTTKKVSEPAQPVSTTTDITVNEQLNIEMTRDGSVKTSRVNGTLNLFAGDRSTTKLKIHSKIEGNVSDFKPHPKMDRASFANNQVLGLKRAEEELPASNVLLVKWAVDNVHVPITISCWVSESSDAGFMNVTAEYEISPEFDGVLENVLVKIPLPSSNAHATDPDASFEQTSEHMVWIIPRASLQENNTGSFEFTAEGEHEDEFYPIEVEFSTAESSNPLRTFGKIDIDSVQNITDGSDVEFNKIAKAQTSSYLIR